MARDISEAERTDFLQVDYDEFNNTYSIRPSLHFQDNLRFVPSFYSREALKDVLALSPKDLELITTIMFVCDEEHVSDKREIVRRVLELKPKFREQEVQSKILPEFCGCA